MKHVTVEREGAIAIVTFDRGAPANALSLGLMRELLEVARGFEEDHETAAIILKGRADNFCLGFDLADPILGQLAEMPLAEQRLAFSLGKRMCAAWEALEPVTICAIEGWCVGGGLALAVSTDLRVLSDAGGILIPEVARGLNMSWGSVPRITNLVGPARAKRLIMLAESLSTEDALNWGLADALTPAGGAEAQARRFAERAAGLPRAALRQCKQSINAYANALAAVASHADHDQFTLMMGSADAVEGRAAFFEKRPPRFSGR
ncbi:MAG: enoyl-CoA hydratase/isomerase family protein [Pseudomonadota bacterium]